MSPDAPAPRPWVGPAAGLGAGVLLTASLPPWGWWVLGLAGAGLLYSLVATRAWRGRLAVGAACGVGLYVPGLWWVTEFHLVGYAAMLVMQTLILAGALALVPGDAARGRRRAPAALAFPAALVLLEAVRGSWPFGGLPLTALDLGQVGGPLVDVARAGGHLLLVAALGTAGVAVGGAGRWLAARRAGDSALPALAAAAVTGLLVVAGSVAPDGRPVGRLSVAAVQGGGPRGVRAVESDPRRVLEAHLEASEAVRRPVDLVLWPEDVVDVPGRFAGSDAQQRVAELADSLDATLVAGVVEDLSATAFRNAAVAFGPDGVVVDRFDKVHRVPFGEYIPFRSVVERLADVSAVPRDAEAGTGSGLLETPLGPMAVTISFEVFFADRARSGVEAGGQVVLVPTNASSYTTSQVPTQEVAVARLRAVETGRWVVQAAPTGHSAVIDHRGRVRERGPLGARAVLHQVIERRVGRTWAMALGDVPVVAAALVALGAAWLARRSRKVES